MKSSEFRFCELRARVHVAVAGGRHRGVARARARSLAVGSRRLVDDDVVHVGEPEVVEHRARWPAAVPCRRCGRCRGCSRRGHRREPAVSTSSFRFQALPNSMMPKAMTISSVAQIASSTSAAPSSPRARRRAAGAAHSQRPWLDADDGVVRERERLAEQPDQVLVRRLPRTRRCSRAARCRRRQERRLPGRRAPVLVLLVRRTRWSDAAELLDASDRSAPV